MAFDYAGWQRIAFGGAIPATFPTAGSVKSIYSYVTNDLLSEVLASGYFDTLDGDPLKIGDVIIASVDADGTPMVVLLNVTTGGSSPAVRSGAGSGLLQTLSTEAAPGVAAGIIKLALSTAGTLQLGDPIPGVDVVLVQSGTSTAIALTPTSTAVLINFTGNRTLTFVAKDKAVMLRGVTTTQFAIISNVGTVVAS